MTEGITEKFQSSISRYWPSIKDRELNLNYCGIRSKTKMNDFIFLHKKISEKLFILNLYGMESNGLTSCIQIVKYVKKNNRKVIKLKKWSSQKISLVPKGTTLV